MKRRYASVFLPYWAVDLVPVTHRQQNKQPYTRCGSAGHIPLILFHSFTQKDRSPRRSSENSGSPQANTSVAQACECARKAGITRGMALTLAEALAPAPPCCLPLQAERSFALLGKLARWAVRFSPLVALDQACLEAAQNQTLGSLAPIHAGFLIDLTGTQRLHGGETPVIEKLDEALSRRGINARFAVTDTAGASWALARFSPSRITYARSAEDSAAALTPLLSPLPIEALRLSEETAQGLRALGISQVGQLLKIPLRKLSARFPRVEGPQGILTRLRQALGTQHETLAFLHPKTQFRALRHFDIPLTSQSSIARTILDLTGEVLRQLASERKTTRSLLIELVSERTLTTTRKELTLCHATRDAEHLRSVISPLIESIQSIDGISVVSVTARLVNASNGSTPSLPALAASASIEVEFDEAPIQELLNHLVTRLGHEQVTRTQRHSSYIPEDSFSYRSVSAALQLQVEGGFFLKRPSFLFESPQPAEAIAMLPDRPPSLLTWNNTRLKIISAEGPERICYEWWHFPLHSAAPSQRQPNAARDYFRVQDETGRWLWVFREHPSNAWFVHGMWA